MFKPTEKQLKPQHQYAVKYFTQDKIYLCWGRKNKVKIEKFTGLKKDVLIAIENKQPYFSKYSLKRYGDQEKVYVFTKEGVRDFLKELQVNFDRNS